MKRTLVLTMGLLLAAGFASAQIAGSGHDFSGETWTTNQEICLPCHTPHNGAQTGAGLVVPLWNHADTTQTFIPYDSDTLDAIDVGQPAGVSLACLSCHDGVTALDSFGGTTGTTLMTGDASFGLDLSNDHPVSFTYDTALSTTDGELRDPATYTTILGGLLEDDMLFAGEMECASCHDVHNNADTGASFMLRINNANSVLCLTCHAK